MAIARIQGNLLADNLQRSANLSVQGNLLYVDVVNSRIGVLDSTPGVALDVNGNINANGITADNISATANVYAGNLISDGAIVGNVDAGNVSLTGNIVVNSLTANTTVTAQGNVTGNNLISNVAIIVQGSGGNITGADGVYAGILNATGNVVGGNVVANANVVAGNLTLEPYLSGQVTAHYGYFTGNVDVLGNLNASIGVVYANSGIFYGNLVTGNNAGFAGFPGFTQLGSNVVFQFAGNVNSYSQLNFENVSNGTHASTDLVLTADNGNDSSYFLNVGLAGSAWDGTQDNSLTDALGPNDGYIYVHDGNLVIGTNQAGDNLKIIAGGSNATFIVAEYSDNRVDIYGNLFVTGNLSGNIIGNIDASFLTSGTVPAARLTGTYNIDIDGQANTAVTAGTVTTNAQPNITSVGQLSSLSVSGNISSGNIEATLFDSTNTANAPPVAGSYTGERVRLYDFNNAAKTNYAIGVESNYIWTGVDDSTDSTGFKWYGNASLAATLTGTGNLTTVGNVSAPSLLGNLYGNSFGNVSGNLLGNMYGNLDGNLIGSVFGDDGTLLIDSVEENFYGNNISANSFVGPLTGNVTANSVVPGANVTYNIGTDSNQWANIYALRTFVGNSYTGNVLPTANLTGNLGSTTERWRSLWVDGQSIHLGNIVQKEVNSTTIGFFQADGITPAIIDAGSISAGSTLTNGNTQVAAAANANVTFTITSVPTLTVSPNLLTANGNISGNYILGNGSLLSGIITSVANINNGNSNVSIDGAGANITMGVGGVANIVVVYNTGVNISGQTYIDNALVTGNLTVNGNLNTVNVANVEIADPIIGIGRGSNNTPLTLDDGKDRGMGLWYYTTAEHQAFMGYDSSATKMLVAQNVSISNSVVSVNDYGNVVLGNVDAQGNVSGSFLLGNIRFATGVTTNAFSIINLQGWSNAQSGGNVVIESSGLSNLAVNAGNGITLTGNATTDTFAIAVTGSTNDGTLFGAGGNMGLILGDPVTTSIDLGTVVDLVITSAYDLGGLTTANWNQVNNNLLPVVDATYDIGNATNRWNNVTIAGLFSSPISTKTGTSTGTAGQIAWDANYIYVCTATNTWKRVGLNSF